MKYTVIYGTKQMAKLIFPQVESELINMAFQKRRSIRVIRQ